jgi:hypothetical protein
MPNTADVEQGDAVEVPIALERQYGGFTEDGPTQFSGTVTLAKNASIPGATVTLTPTILGAGQTLSTLKVQTTASTPVGNYGVQITASSPGRDDQVIGTIIKVAAPPPSGGGGGGTYVCPGTLPSGYQCVDIPDGRQAPVKYAGLTNGPSGAWNNSGLGVCMNLGANGVATFTYSAGVYGGPTNAQGKWGAMVSSTGVVVAGNGTVYYILTGSTDAQIALQNWDSGTGQWVQGGWEAGGC